MTKEDFRKNCRHLLHTPIDFWGKLINGAIAALIVLSIATIPLYFIPQLEWARGGLFALEICTVLFFTVEYTLRTWSAQSPVKYAFSWSGIIDLLAIAPFYLEILGVMQGGVFFLALRALRLLKLGRIYCSERLTLATLSRMKHGDFKAVENETVDYVAQKHPLLFFIWLLPPIVFTSLGLSIFLVTTSIIGTIITVLLLGFAFVFFLKAWLDFHYDAIYVTNYRIIIQNRQLFGTRLNDIVYEAITNIRPDNTGIIQYFFGFGDIHIETAASSGNQVFTDVSDPHKVVQIISRNRQKTLERKELSREYNTQRSANTPFQTPPEKAVSPTIQTQRESINMKIQKQTNPHVQN